MTYQEYIDVSYPDFRITYTYDNVPYVYVKDEDGMITVTLQGYSKESENSRAHGYSVHRSTLKKIVNELENDGGHDCLSDESEEMFCPFCESSAYAKEWNDGKWYIQCCYCGTATPPSFNSKEEAINFWNSRM